MSRNSFYSGDVNDPELIASAAADADAASISAGAAAVSAAQAATDAEQVRDYVTNVYLGALVAAPTVAEIAAAEYTAGTWYFNTTNDLSWILTSALEWQPTVVSTVGMLPSGGGTMTGDLTMTTEVEGATNTVALVDGRDVAADGAQLDTNTTAIATNASDIAAKAPIASPTFTGTVAIPNIVDLETAVAANTAKIGITTSQASAITTNSARSANATHTGDVTGATVLTITDDAVTADKLADLINTDIAIGVAASATANDALPKTGGTMTGPITVELRQLQDREHYLANYFGNCSYRFDRQNNYFGNPSTSSWSDLIYSTNPICPDLI